MKKEITIGDAFDNLVLPRIPRNEFGGDGPGSNQRRKKSAREAENKESPPDSKKQQRSARRKGLSA